MKKINWKKLNSFEKIIFSLGWLNVVSLAFWIAMIIYNNYNQDEKFFNSGSYRVVYVFGWITFIGICIILINEIIF